MPVETVLVGEIAYHPLGQHKLVGGTLYGTRQKLYLVLLEHLAVGSEVAHLRVAVLGLAAGLCDIGHALLAELVELSKRPRLVIAALVNGWEHLVVFGYDVILKLAHGFVSHARGLGECFGRAVQRLLGRAGEGAAVLVEERAQQAQRGNLGERADERRAETRHYVEVAALGLYERRKQTRAVNALAVGKYRLEIGQVVNHEVERLHAAVLGRIHEVDHAYALLANEGDDVGFGQFGCRFPEMCH